jgi:uncharacterized protein (DUF3084 family)
MEVDEHVRELACRLGDDLAAFAVMAERQSASIQDVSARLDTFAARTSELRAFLTSAGDADQVETRRTHSDFFHPSGYRSANGPGGSATGGPAGQHATVGDVEALRHDISHLRREVQVRDLIVAARDDEIDNWRHEVDVRDAILAARDEAIAFLRREAEVRDELVRDRDQTIPYLRQEIEARDEAISFLRREIETRDNMLNARDEAIRFLEAELTTLRAIVAARDEAIDFLTWHVADRER